MRILRLRVANWRNFRDVNLLIEEDSTLVCLVGENGTGKSNILELISAAANRLGISPGIDNPRGNVFGEIHDISVEFRFDISLQSKLADGFVANLQRHGIEWNGVITLYSKRDSSGSYSDRIIAGGAGNETLRCQLADQIRHLLQQEKETNYLSLDADRSYPPMQVQPHQYAEALGRDWDSLQWQRNRAFVPTRAMYDEWLQYFLAKESQIATRHLQAERRAAEGNGPRPTFTDSFKPYKEAVQKVLPHLRFVGVDTQSKTLVFDSSGLELRFTNLSGGEREISFIIGQIERFRLRRGFLLIDEPELHLNPDLLRNWVAYLRDTIETGQVWISTHSLEAVETASPGATFVLERTRDTRLVEKITPLSSRPVLSVLSAAVGSPAFSLRNLRFVYIEGDRRGREKERFFGLYGDERSVRFIEGGGCKEVTGKLAAVRELALDAEEQIKVGGVIDRDFRTDVQIAEIESRTPIFTLDCHEVENLFLHLDALQIIANRSGVGVNACDALREASDRFAGLWILGRTVTISARLHESTKPLRQISSALDWVKFEADMAGAISLIADAALSRSHSDYSELHKDLSESAEVYSKLRVSPDLWKKCMGKEVLGVLPAALGLRGPDVLQSNVLKIWKLQEANHPQELIDLKAYIDSIV